MRIISALALAIILPACQAKTLTPEQEAQVRKIADEQAKTVVDRELDHHDQQRDLYLGKGR
jgi:hypothetical protein